MVTYPENQVHTPLVGKVRRHVPQLVSSRLRELQGHKKVSDKKTLLAISQRNVESEAYRTAYQKINRYLIMVILINNNAGL